MNGFYQKQYEDVCGECKVAVRLANAFEYFNIMGKFRKMSQNNQYIISGNSKISHSTMKITEQVRIRQNTGGRVKGTKRWFEKE